MIFINPINSYTKMKKILQAGMIHLLAVATMFAVASPVTANAAGRDFIRNSIKKYGKCNNVAITRTGGDVMIYGRNGYALSEGCPKALGEALEKLNANSEHIKDVQLTEEGRYLVLYGTNAMIWNDVPAAMEKKMREYNDKGYTITSASFNDSGDWVIIAEEYYSSSSTELQEWLNGGLEKFGALWAVCVTDDAAVACYEKGYRFLGDVPQDLKDSLTETKISVYYIKMAGTAWFYADKKGNYAYNM